MRKSMQCTVYVFLAFTFWSIWRTANATEHNYFRSVPLIKSTDQFASRKLEELKIAGIDLVDYGFRGVLKYGIVSPALTLFVLGGNQAGELILGAVNLTDRNFTVLTQFSAEERKQIRVQDINFATCFQDHPYSHERLRYVFLTYILGKKQSKTELKVFRMENDDSLTFREMASTTTIGETDMVYTDATDAPYIYSRRDNAAEPGIQIVPRLMMADVNHDKFMDLVIWRRIYLANPRDAATPLGGKNAYEQHVFKHFTRDREEVQVMFFDWENVSFAEPVTTQTEGLGNDVFWRFLFPSYWAQDYYDWMKSPSE